MNKSTQTLHVHLLGDFRLVYGDEPVTSVKSARMQSLLAYLVLHRDAPQSRHYLAFLFWPDSTEAQALTNLRNLLHHLRHRLPDADQFLQVDTQTVQWGPNGPFTLDVAGFESVLAQAERAEQAGDQAAAREALEEAVALYQGDLLPSCYDDWIRPERERLSQAFTGALEQLGLLLEGQREYRAAIGHARRMLQRDPLHEGTCRRLMRLHALTGDRAAALRVYHTCATALERELGMEPSATPHACSGAGRRLAPGGTTPGVDTIGGGLARGPRWTAALRAVDGRIRHWQDAASRGTAPMGQAAGHRCRQRPLLRCRG
jgi:DNA-binding SARP family transcriptional activator